MITNDAQKIQFVFKIQCFQSDPVLFIQFCFIVRNGNFVLTISIKTKPLANFIFYLFFILFFSFFILFFIFYFIFLFLFIFYFLFFIFIFLFLFIFIFIFLFLFFIFLPFFWLYHCIIQKLYHCETVERDEISFVMRSL